TTSFWSGTTTGKNVLWSNANNWEGGAPISSANQDVTFGITLGMLPANYSTDSDYDLNLDLRRIQFLGISIFGNTFHVRDKGPGLRLVGSGTTLFDNANTLIDPMLTAAVNDQTWALNNGFSLVVKQVTVDAVGLTISPTGQAVPGVIPTMFFSGPVLGN